MKQIVMGIVLFLTSCTYISSQADQMDKYVKDEMQKNHIPGISVAVLSQGKIVFSRQYGLSNVELSVLVNSNSPFKIASLTKPITAIAVMLLAEEGKLSLDSMLSHYLQELPSQWNTVTVRQVLSHTSGIPDYFQSPDWSWRNSWRLDLTHDEFLKMTAKAPMTFNPGTNMKYSNSGFYLLGMLIENVSGNSYEEYIDKHVFKPLQMNSTRRDSAEAIIPNRVSGYTFKDGKLRNAEYTSDTWAYSEGGIITTALDLAKFDSALYTDKLLKRSTIEQMWTPSNLSNGKKGVIGDNGAGKPNYYGLGWYISDYHNHKLILHGGQKPGFTSNYFRFINDKLTVIVLSNLSYSPLYEIAGRIADLYFSK
jgi:CubicO group peptidase (beta-lactamase class C family)